MWKIQQKFVCLSLIIFNHLRVFAADSRRSVTFRAARARFSPIYFANFTISVKNGSIYNDMYVRKELKPGFKTNLDFQLRLKDAKKYQSLFGYDVDVCSVVVAYKETVFKKWFKSALRYGNFMLNCPVSVGHYYLNGWHLESSLVPTYLYPGDYRIKGYGYYGHYKRADEVFAIQCEVDATIT